jgi:ABC-type sugar transport system substrate-binding protein
MNTAAASFLSSKTDAELLEMLEVLDQPAKWNGQIEDAVAENLYTRHNVEDKFWGFHLDNDMTVIDAMRKALEA